MASTTNTLLQKLVNGKSLQKVLDSDAESFAEVPLTKYLQELCEERDVVPEQVIKKAQIDRTYGHQIFNGTRNPSRDKLIQLAVGFGLSLDETQMLLKKAGKSVLYSKIKSDAAKAQKVAVDFSISVKGINITAKNSTVYVDDIQIAKADGTVLAKKNFTSAKSADGNCIIAPKNDWDKDAKELKLATITDNKVLTVKSTKATVKVGKTTKISATATPATKITYTSSNKKVATVSSKGVITGKKAGKAVISVKANGKTVKVTVTVKKK